VLKLLLKWDKLEWVKGVWEQVREYPERYFAEGDKVELEIGQVEIVLEAIGRQGDLESAEGELLLPPLPFPPLHLLPRIVSS
jgi:hypothetical protein